MSRYLIYHINKETEEEIEDTQLCRWLINDICCMDECNDLADYPYPIDKCYKNSKKKCKYFKEEDEI